MKISQKLDALEKGLSGLGVQLIAIESVVCHLQCMVIYKETIKRGSPNYLGAIIRESENLIKKQLGTRLQNFECSKELSEEILAYRRELFEQIRFTLGGEIKQLKAFGDGASAVQ